MRVVMGEATISAGKERKHEEIRNNAQVPGVRAKQQARSAHCEREQEPVTL